MLSWKRSNCKPRLLLFCILAIIIIHLHRGLLEAELKEPIRRGDPRFQLQFHFHFFQMIH